MKNIYTQKYKEEEEQYIVGIVFNCKKVFSLLPFAAFLHNNHMYTYSLVWELIFDSSLKGVIAARLLFTPNSVPISHYNNILHQHFSSAYTYDVPPVLKTFVEDIPDMFKKKKYFLPRLADSYELYYTRQKQIFEKLFVQILQYIMPFSIINIEAEILTGGQKKEGAYGWLQGIYTILPFFVKQFQTVPHLKRFYLYYTDFLYNTFSSFQAVMQIERYKRQIYAHSLFYEVLQAVPVVQTKGIESKQEVQQKQTIQKQEKYQQFIWTKEGDA